MSIGKAWEEARESSLLFPVALLFVALPGLILQEMTPPELAKWNLAESTMPQVPGSFWLAMLLAVIIIWFGSLTLFALALRPGISVGEALRLSFARLPVLLGVALVVAGFLAGAVIAASSPSQSGIMRVFRVTMATAAIITPSGSMVTI